MEKEINLKKMFFIISSFIFFILEMLVLGPLLIFSIGLPIYFFFIYRWMTVAEKKLFDVIALVIICSIVILPMMCMDSLPSFISIEVYFLYMLFGIPLLIFKYIMDCVEDECRRRRR